MNPTYDTPVGVGGQIDKSGQVLSGPLAGEKATEPLSTSSLSPTNPAALPPTPPSTAVPGALGYISSINDGFTKNLADKASADRAGANSSLQDIIKSMGSTTGEAGLTDTAYSSNVDPLSKEVAGLSSQITAEQVASRHAIEQLQANPGGLSTGALASKANDIQRESLSKQADLAVILAAKNGQLGVAKSIADRAVTAKLEADKQRNDTLQFIYQQNKSLFDKSDQRAFESAQADRTRALDDQKYKEHARFDELIKQSDPLYQAQLTKSKHDASLGNYSGAYVPGANPVVDSWAQRIFDGTAKITDIPANEKGLRDAVTVALQASGNDLAGKPTVTELGKASKDTASDLLARINRRNGGSIVVGSILPNFTVPGTEQANFINDFNTLKSQLALEGVKYLKGQGQVSDAERALLSSAVTKLNLRQSPAEFKTTLQGIIDRLSGTPATAPPPPTTIVAAPDGSGDQIQLTD